MPCCSEWGFRLSLPGCGTILRLDGFQNCPQDAECVRRATGAKIVSMMINGESNPERHSDEASQLSQPDRTQTAGQPENATLATISARTGCVGRRMPGRSCRRATPRQSFSTGSRRRAFFAGRGAPAACRCGPTPASFSTVEEAQASGFRACQRCRPEEPLGPSPVARMCAHLAANLDRPVTLAELGRRAKMSPFSAQRLFKKEMGATPAQYQRALRANGLREQLQKGATVTEAIYEAGYGSSSRVYEQAPLGMTPRRFLAGGRGERMRFAVAEAGELGWMIVGATERGICWLAIADSPPMPRHRCRTEFPAAEIAADPELEKTVRTIIDGVQGSKHQQSCRWICAERPFNCGSGVRCRRFPQARRRPTASWPRRWAFRLRRGP